MSRLYVQKQVAAWPAAAVARPARWLTRPLTAALLALVACTGRPASSERAPATGAQPAARSLLPGPKPPAPGAAADLVGEYDCDTRICLLIEDAGRLWLLDTTRASPSRTPLDPFTPSAGARWPTKVGNVVLKHRAVGPEPGTTQLQVQPVRPLAELRAEALAASPPAEPPPARPAELVELTALDSTIRLEIRYATTNNFLGTRFYDSARAFMQRPAAEAVVRANRKLRALGYGLLVHDAYRPWYVTRMFWDATPADKRWLVADPSQGSKHNRGAAVDLTLFDLATGRPVAMPSTYDESTGRAFADYPGGTSLERWHRALLRNAMVAEGFLVNPSEWWHFDYTNWRDYGIGNVTFERIAR